MNTGIVQMSAEYILKLLDLEGGAILQAQVPFEVVGIVEFLIEHPDMPLLERNYHVPRVNVVLKRDFERGGETRINPPKRY